MSSLNYKINSNGKSQNVVGIHKTSMGGSKQENLFQSLKNGNYLILKELEKI